MKKHFKELVREDTKKCIVELLEFLQDTQLENDSIILYVRLMSNEQKNNRGEITQAEYQANRNRLVLSVLSLIDKMSINLQRKENLAKRNKLGHFSEEKVYEKVLDSLKSRFERLEWSKRIDEEVEITYNNYEIQFVDGIFLISVEYLRRDFNSSGDPKLLIRGGKKVYFSIEDILLSVEYDDQKSECWGINFYSKGDEDTYLIKFKEFVKMKTSYFLYIPLTERNYETNKEYIHSIFMPFPNEEISIQIYNIMQFLIQDWITRMYVSQ